MKTLDELTQTPIMAEEATVIESKPERTERAKGCPSQPQRRTRDISLERILRSVSASNEARSLLQRLRPLTGPKPDFTALHGTYLVLNFFSAFASDEANVGKISTMLELAATELQTLSERIKGLLD